MATKIAEVMTQRPRAVTPQMTVREAARLMDEEDVGRDVVALTPDHELDDALRLMAREQVRRVPIVVRENQLVGMLAQADVAHAGREKATGEVVEAVSRAPGGPRVASSDVDRVS
jgi:CBS domain-containing protein